MVQVSEIWVKGSGFTGGRVVVRRPLQIDLYVVDGRNLARPRLRSLQGKTWCKILCIRSFGFRGSPFVGLCFFG